MKMLAGKLPGLIVVAVIVGGGALFLNDAIDRDEMTDQTTIAIPKFSDLARRGEMAFADNCANCHGANASGGPGGPPLVHKIYEPNHHGDGSFLLAMQRGVVQHHWRFGNMPLQPQVGPDDAAAIVRYVRELQAANGIR